MYNWFRDDITFCLNECNHTECFRHPDNIEDKTQPHSFAYCKGVEDWCMLGNEVKEND